EGGVAGVPVVGGGGVERPGRVGVAVGPGPAQGVGVEAAALLATGDEGEQGLLDVVVAVAAEGVGDALALDLEIAGPDRPVALGAVQHRPLGVAAYAGGSHAGRL